MMPLNDEHSVPVDQENVREELEEMLDIIYRETAPMALVASSYHQLPARNTFKKQPKPAQTGQAVQLGAASLTGQHDSSTEFASFAGRYVTKVVSVYPLEVTKRFVWPHLTHEGICRPSAKLIVRKLFNIDTMENALLVITPTATASRGSDKCIVHCYTKDTQWHLGASNLVSSEKELILQQAHGPEALSVIFCSAYIELEDAYMPTAIKAQLFEMLEQQTKLPVDLWYKGRRITLDLWCTKTPEEEAEELRRLEEAEQQKELNEKMAQGNVKQKLRGRQPGGTNPQNKIESSEKRHPVLRKPIAAITASACVGRPPSSLAKAFSTKLSPAEPKIPVKPANQSQKEDQKVAKNKDKDTNSRTRKETAPISTSSHMSETNRRPTRVPRKEVARKNATSDRIRNRMRELEWIKFV
ncbi:hypothetical protein KR222_007802 [Zaprionus bogoriensis]|nr:hypothetical protein KR222_007802 [Zaprionus bogoriensis]